MTDELITDEASYANMGRSARAAYTYDPDIFLEEDNSAEWSAAYQQIYLYNVIANGVMDKPIICTSDLHTLWTSQQDKGQHDTTHVG